MAYGHNNGLPASFYYSVLQSSDGYLWIGSSSGLIRFDGKRYETFFSDYTNPNSLSDNVINDIIEDDEQNLWIAGLYQGLTKYNLRTGNMKRYARLSEADKTAYGIRQLFFDQGELWIGTDGQGLAHYIAEADSFEFFMPKPSDQIKSPSPNITGIAKDKHQPDLLWLSSFTGLYSFDTRNKVFTAYSLPHPNQISTTLQFLCIETDDDHAIWLGTWYAGLLRFDIESKTFQTFPYSKATPANSQHYVVLDIKSINDSIIYLATGNDGLLTLNTNKPEVRPLLTQEQLPDGSSGIDIQRISKTPDAGVFVGGNYFIYQEHPSFNRFNRSVSISDDLEFELEQVVYDSLRHGYWMACLNVGALVFFDDDMDQYHLYHAADNKPIQALDVAIDSKNRIWVTTVLSGLLILNEKDNTFHEISNEFPSLTELPDLLYCVENDIAGNLWFAGRSQLYYLDASQQVQSFDLGFDHASGGYNLVLKCGLRGEVWLGSLNGLYHFLPDRNEVTQLLPDKSNSNGIANAYIKAMTIDKDGNAWIGFENDGVQVIRATDHKLLQSFNLKNGLPCMQVNYMSTDADGGIWAGTASGLSYFNPDASTPIWQLFNRQDGVKRDYVDRSIATTTTGKLFFNLVKGISWIDLHANKENSNTQPQLHILSFLVDGHPIQFDLLPTYLTEVNLDYNVKEIRIEFAAMDWLHPFRTKYFYHIEGINTSNEWIENKEAVISLSGMKPGGYAIQLYAVSGDGIKSEVMSLPIIIHPPFWQRWWFLSLCAIALSALVYSIYQYRIRQLQKLQAMRNTISTNLHDDIGASLSNIHILTVLTQRNIENTPRATSYITKASDEIQRISESLSDIVWNISPKYDDINQLFIRMKRYAADMLDGKQIIGELNFPSSTAQVRMPMDQRRDFYLIFKEGVNNLVKYANASSARVSVTIDDQLVRLEIKDNGVGFDESTIQVGNGIQNMKQRASKWKAKLQIQSHPGQGTSLLLEMKVNG